MLLKSLQMKKFYLAILLAVILSGRPVLAQNLYAENFDDVGSLFTTGGWTQQNNSSPMGFEIWHNGVYLSIPALSGPDSSYAEVSYRSTDSTGVGTISNWLISPPINLSNGDLVSFYTSSLDNVSNPDGLELRLNDLNTTDVGSSASSTGDFSTLLLALNPNHYHDTAYYPQDYWGRFAVSISGLSGPTLCRIAFRYTIPFAGGGGLNGSAIGIDDFSVDGTLGTGVQTVQHLNLYPNPAKNQLGFDFSLPLSREGRVAVYDARGNLIRNIPLYPAQTKLIIPTHDLSPGIYSTRIETGSETITKIFIKD
jgi:hypothetical protein